MGLDKCPTDETLRAFELGELAEPDLEELAEHLEACPTCESRSVPLDQAADGLLSALMNPTQRTPPLSDPPVTNPSRWFDGMASARPRHEPPSLRNYEMLGKLGEGGMAVVFKARHKDLNRIVALKMIRHGYSLAEEVARFREEAQAVARLQHPNLVQVFEIAEQAGELFLALEYVDGKSLEAYLDGEPQPAREAAQLVETLARAIHHAHERGIVHRDLKPANILLQKTSADNGHDNGLRGYVPKIADFGLAKRIDTDLGLTQTGIIVGTPSYMAPEQAAGKTTRFGRATDIHNLGVMLYEMLTGRVPYKAATVPETLRLVESQEPLSPRQLQPGLSRDLETICLKCLEKAPHKRYATALDLADDLRRFLDGEPIHARPVSRFERAFRWCRRRPVITALIMALLLVLVGGVSGILWQWQEAVAARHDAEINEQSALALAFKEQEARKAAEIARQAEQRQRRQVQEALARIALTQAVALCERGDVDHGVLWLVDALEFAERAESAELERALRLELGAWRPLVHRLDLCIAADANVWSLAFHPDGTSFAGLVGELNTTLRRWETATGRVLPSKAVEPKGFAASWLVFHPDGGLLYGSRQMVRLDWPGPVPMLKGLKAGVLIRAAAVSHDGKTLALVCGDQTLRVNDVASGQPRFDPILLEWEPRTVVFSPDDAIVVTAGGRLFRNEALIVDAATGQVRGQPIKEKAMPLAAAFSPDGKALALGSVSGSIRAWSLAGMLLNPPASHAAEVRAMAWNKDGRLLATGSTDQTARLWQPIWNLEKPNAELTLKPFGPPLRHREEVTSAAFSPDGSRLVTGGRDESIRLWRPAAGAPRPETLRSFSGPGLCILSHDGRLLFRSSAGAAGAANECQVYETQAGQPVGPAWTPPARIADAAFSADKKGLILASPLPDGPGHALQRWDIAAGKPVGNPVPVPNQGLRSFSPDGRTLLCQRDREFDILVDTETGRTLAEVRTNNIVCRTAWSLDSTRLTIFGLGVGVQTCDAVTGKMLWAKQPPAPTLAAAYSPDGALLVTGHGDRTARLWDAATGMEHGTPLRHPLQVHQVKFGRDGELLTVADNVQSSTASEVRRWRLTPAGAEPVGQPFSPGGKVRLALGSPDGNLIATLSGGTVRLWDPATDKPVGPALDVANVRLTIAFAADGKSLLLIDPASGMQRWPMPEAAGGTSEALRSWAESSTGLELDAGGAVQVLTPDAWQTRLRP